MSSLTGAANASSSRSHAPVFSSCMLRSNGSAACRAAAFRSGEHAQRNGRACHIVLTLPSSRQSVVKERRRSNPVVWSAMPDQSHPEIRVALEGDLVYVHFDCTDETGELVDSTRTEEGVPLSFEVGAGDLFANEMIKAMDAAVRGLAVGDMARVEAQGNDWKEELLFQVPRDHPEMQRLEGRYKNVGGLAPSLVVELANGSRAVVLDITPDVVKLDANSMLAGKKLVFEIELAGIEGST